MNWKKLVSKRMKFIITLVLLIPTYGLSLIFLLIYLYLTQRKILAAIPSFIQQAPESGLLCEDLKFVSLLAFAKEHGINVVIEKGYFEFSWWLKGETNYIYRCKVTRHMPTSDAILSATKYLFLYPESNNPSVVTLDLYQYWRNAGISDNNIHFCLTELMSGESALNNIAKENNNKSSLD